MHPELSSSVAQIRFKDLGLRTARRGRFSAASGTTLPPPRERDPVGRGRYLV